MIKFFRTIRQSLINENKMGKYFKYAIGEIILVVIGILIALQINKWNEYQKLKKNEKEILNNIVRAIDNDLGIYNNLFEYRLEKKRIAIDTLIYFIGTNTMINDSIFMSYFSDVDNNIVARFDSGPYDALKVGGFHQITDDSLREQIINTYQVLLPSFVYFTTITRDVNMPTITQNKNQLLTAKVTKDENSKFITINLPRNKNILTEPKLIKVLHLEKEVYWNYKDRLRSMKGILGDLKKNIETELTKTND